MASKKRPWLDILDRKHECGPSLSPYVSLDLAVGGRTETLRIPDELDIGLLEIKAVIGDGPLIAVIASHPGDEEVEGPFCILMVAKQSDDGPFVVHVWHELFPWALEHLGLSAPPARGHASDER